jgi:hypothetical protein
MELPDALRDSERARLLQEAGFMVDHYPNSHDQWFVGLGSHGGSAPTIRKALKRCLRCCNIGKYWHLDYSSNGPFAKDVAESILEQTTLTEENV